MKKPAFENAAPPYGSSIKLHVFSPGANNNLAWHVHPEIELVYIKGGEGKRHIANHISHYSQGDLILIGSNLPHFGFTNAETGNKKEVVVQLKEDFMGPMFFDAPEMKQIKSLFERARRGIVFNASVKKKLGPQIEALQKLNHFEMLLRFLDILQELAVTKEYSLLNVEGPGLQIEPQDHKRLEKIVNFSRENFQRSISLEEIAGVANMTVPAFCKYIKKKTGKTFTRLVNEQRLAYAAKKLSGGGLGVTEVCFDSGFNNLSHFNRLFKEFTGKNPTAYRNQFSVLL